MAFNSRNVCQVIKTINRLRPHQFRFISSINHPQAHITQPRLRPSLGTHAFKSSTVFQTRPLSTELRTAITKATTSAPVVLFMKGTPASPRCGFSRAAVSVLAMEGVDPAKFAAYDVLADDQLRSGIKEFSDWMTIPQVYIDGQFVGGCDLLVEMHKSGELATLLRDSNVLAQKEGESPVEAEKKE